MVNKLRLIFGQIKDPGRDVTKLHKLDDILLIGIMAVISGAQSWIKSKLYFSCKAEPKATIPRH